MMMKTYICDNCGMPALATQRGADCDCGGTYSMTPGQGAGVIMNLTPHVVRLNDGTEYPPSGVVARMATVYRKVGDCPPRFEKSERRVEGLPLAQWDVSYIVSKAMMEACAERSDLLTPATGHPDTVRVNGQVYSVPGFI